MLSITNHIVLIAQDKMAEEYETELTQSGSVSPTKESEIMNRNLGSRRSRLSGIGPTLTKSALRRLRNVETPTTFEDPRDAKIKELETNQELMLSALRHYIPGFQLPTPPPRNDPSSASSANQLHDDHEDHDGEDENEV